MQPNTPLTSRFEISRGSFTIAQDDDPQIVGWVVAWDAADNGEYEELWIFIAPSANGAKDSSKPIRAYDPPSPTNPDTKLRFQWIGKPTNTRGNECQAVIDELNGSPYNQSIPCGTPLDCRLHTVVVSTCSCPQD